MPIHTGLKMVLIACGLLLAAPAAAQGQCGVVTAIDFPVDRTVFHNVQDFGVASPRHQGRYHTGEDYYGPRAAAYGYGLPVRAIAAGRVTYSAPTGWGRDGGVVIIEHTFPDGSVAYSQYGHMEELNGAVFPARYACIEAGAVIGSVGNARPAPHLHFEIRINQPDVPGPGYTWEFPTALGFRQPTPFVLNWKTWLQPYHRWHLEREGGTPPLIFDDFSLLILDGDRLRYATPDGRVLWRINLERPALALTWLDGAPLLTFADGAMQLVNRDGTLGERWETGAAIEGSPLIAGDRLLFQAPGDRLLAFQPDRRGVDWRLENVPPLIGFGVSGGVVGLVTQTNELLTITSDGRLLDRVQLRAPASLSAAPDGGLLAYSYGGLWHIDAQGVWSLAQADAPPGGSDSAALETASGGLLVFTGSASGTPALIAYNRDGAPLWQLDLAGVSGRAYLALHDTILLLTTGGGDLIAVQAASGALCNRTAIYGAGPLWHSLGSDGTLRLGAAGHITGLDWKEFLGGCA